MKVVVTDWDLGETGPVAKILGPVGGVASFHECATAAEVSAVAGDADALMVRWTPIDGDVLDACPNVRIISRLGIGEWQVDLAAATERHVAVAHCPRYCTDEAVAHTMALMLALNRRLDTARAALREGLWHSYGEGVRVECISSLTLGLIGLGRVGSGVATAARALGMDVIATDPHVLSGPEGVELTDLETVLAEADIVCLQCPVTATTKGLINAATLARMKPGSWLVNTARGALVDEAALLAALDSGHLAGAALDVLADEPPAPDHPLLRHPAVLATPHVGFYSEEALHELKIYGTRNVVHYLTGERVSGLLTPDFRRV